MIFLKALPYLILLNFAGKYLFSYGMFVDGQLHGLLAHNLYLGYGGPWEMVSYPNWPYFIDQSPFVMWIQALLFHVIDHIKLEAWYSIANMFVHLYLLGAIAKVNKSSGWPAQLMLVSLPLVAWLTGSNQLEVTLITLSLSSTLFFLKAHQHIGFQKTAFLFLSGMFFVGCILTKSAFGMYLLVMPLFYFFLNKHFSIRSYLIFLTPLILFVNYVLLDPVALSFWKDHLGIQVFNSIAGKREKVHPYFFILIKLLGELVVAAVMGGLIYYLSRCRKKLNLDKVGGFYLGIALSAFLPFLLSPKNTMWYLYLSLPYFCLFMGQLLKSHAIKIEELIKESTPRLLKALCIVLFISFIGITWTFAGKPIRDHDYYEDIYFKLKKQKPEDLVGVKACPEIILANWNVRARLMRDFKMYFVSTGSKYIFTDIRHPCPESQSCISILSGAKRTYDILECKK